jgi:uncharacterized membrane protein YsdA (DUF1294 family)
MSAPAWNSCAWPAAYVLLMSLASCFLMWLDKFRSKYSGAIRVPERTFFLLAILGGSPGAIAGMLLFHHKTRHWYFMFGLPAILLVQLAVAAYYILN